MTHVYYGLCIVLALGVGGLGGMRVQEYLTPDRVCEPRLADGRALIAYYLDARECVYEAPKPRRWGRM